MLIDTRPCRDRVPAYPSAKVKVSRASRCLGLHNGVRTVLSIVSHSPNDPSQPASPASLSVGETRYRYRCASSCRCLAPCPAQHWAAKRTPLGFGGPGCQR